MRLFSYLLFLSITFGQSIQFSVDRNRLEEGDMLTFSVEASGSNGFAQIDINPVKSQFEIVSGPGQQTNIQWINGQMTSTKTLTWTLSPKNSGTLTIPALNGTLDGKPFKGKPIKIHVSDNETSIDNSVFIVAEIDKDKAYLGEQITLTYKLYKNVNLSIEPFQMPEFSGFWVEELYTPQRVQYRNVTLNGVQYQVANLGQVALFPIPSETHTIPELKVKVQVESRQKKRRRDPFFDPFFDSFFTETKTKIIRSDKKQISITPFPEPKPFDFSGAVGSFNISAKTDREMGKVNEGLTFTISLKGTGNIGLFSIPEIEFPDNIEAFPPTDSFDKDSFRDDLTGVQSWEYILIPRVAGPITIPRVQMSYFNPTTNQWHRTNTDPIEIPIEVSDSPVIDNSGLTKREIELLGQDIRFIHTNEISFNELKKPNTALYLYIASILLFISPTFISKFTGYRLSTEESRKIRGALKSGLKAIRNHEGDAFESASKGLYTYLKQKLLLTTDQLDPSSVSSLLENQISSETLMTLNECLKSCDAGKYAPGGIERETTITAEMTAIMKQLDRELS